MKTLMKREGLKQLALIEHVIYWVFCDEISKYNLASPSHRFHEVLLSPLHQLLFLEKQRNEEARAKHTQMSRLSDLF